MKGKRILAAVTAGLMMTSLLAGCGDSGKKTSSENSDVSKLRILWWGTQARHDNTIKVLDMYEEKTGDVDFEPEFMGYSGYYEKIATLAAANNMPDIMQFDTNGITTYAQNKRLLDLSGLVESNVIDTTNIPENVIESGRIGDGIYALSLGTNAPAMAYNPEILKKAGIDEIPMDWTWDDMEKIFKAIVDKTDAYPTDTVNNFGSFYYYLRLKGKSLYNAEGTGLGYDDDKLFVDYFDRYVDYMKKGYMIPPEELVAGGSIEDGHFALGKVAMQLNWSNSFAAFEQATGVDIKIIPLPDEGSVEAMYTKPTLYFALSANTKHPEKAAGFLNFFVNDIEANKVLNAERGVPISSAVREALLPGLDNAQKKVFEYIDYLSENSSLMDPLPPGCGAEIDTLLSEIDEQIRFGKIDTKTAAKEFRKQAEAIFARSK